MAIEKSPLTKEALENMSYADIDNIVRNKPHDGTQKDEDTRDYYDSVLELANKLGWPNVPTNPKQLYFLATCQLGDTRVKYNADTNELPDLDDLEVDYTPQLYSNAGSQAVSADSGYVQGLLSQLVKLRESNVELSAAMEDTKLTVGEQIAKDNPVKTAARWKPDELKRHAAEEAKTNRVKSLLQISLDKIDSLDDLLFIANNLTNFPKIDRDVFINKIAQKLLDEKDMSQIKEINSHINENIFFALKKLSPDNDKIVGIMNRIDPNDFVLRDVRQHFHDKVNRFLEPYVDKNGNYGVNKKGNVDTKIEITLDDIRAYEMLSEATKKNIAPKWEAVNKIYENRFNAVLNNVEANRDAKKKEVGNLVSDINEKRLLDAQGHDKTGIISMPIANDNYMSLSELGKNNFSNIYDSTKHTDASSVELQKTVDKYNSWNEYSKALRAGKPEVGKELGFHLQKLNAFNQDLGTSRPSPGRKVYAKENEGKTNKEIVSSHRDPLAERFFKWIDSVLGTSFHHSKGQKEVRELEKLTVAAPRATRN